MASPPPSPVASWRWWHTAGLLLATVLIFILCAQVSLNNRLALWWGVMLLLSTAALLVGQGITGYWRGILIDGRNKMSLSRLQLALWTVLIVSAFLVLFFWRLRTPGTADPLGFTIPPQIWALLGISATSLVGSSLVKTSKKNQSRNLAQETETERQVIGQGQDPSTLLVTGREVLNESPAQASWADLFRGEESGNAATASLGKFQMFYFTLVAVASYGYVLAAMFSSSKPGDGFPDVSPGLLGLLGISHGGYLAEKAVPHTQDPASTQQVPQASATVPSAPALAPGPATTSTLPAAAPVIGRTARRLGQP